MTSTHAWSHRNASLLTLIYQLQPLLGPLPSDQAQWDTAALSSTASNLLQKLGPASKNRVGGGGGLGRAQAVAQRDRLERVRDLQVNTEDFDVIAELSTGECGKVELVTSRLSDAPVKDKLFVLKTVQKTAASRMREHLSPLTELEILRLSRSDSNPPIPLLHAAFQTPTALQLLTAYYPGGDLYTLLVSLTPSRCPEKWVSCWTAEAVDALGWLHAEGWVHRDIKPGNFLLGADGHLALTDFGSAARLRDWASEDGRWKVAKRHSTALIGTSDYIAPEVLLAHEKAVLQAMEETTVVEDETFSPSYRAAKAQQRDENEEGAYGAEVDWWSLGVSVYELLYGETPFFCEAVSGTYEKIIAHDQFLIFSSEVPVSQGMKDLLQELITGANERLGYEGVDAVKAHPFFAPVNWNTLRQDTPPFLPTLRRPSPLSQSSLRSNQSRPFDFSAFFASSPGLSILRPSPSSQSPPTSSEWEHFGFLPPSDEFTVPAPYEFPSEGPKPTTLAAPPRQLSYITPVRPTPSYAALRTAAMSATTVAFPAAQGQASGSHSRRQMSELEEWRELVDHAAHTAKKRAVSGRSAVRSGSMGKERLRKVPTLVLQKMDSTPPATPKLVGTKRRAVVAPVLPAQQRPLQARAANTTSGESKWNHLEARQKVLVGSLDDLESKYENLFRLAADVTGTLPTFSSPSSSYL